MAILFLNQYIKLKTKQKVLLKKMNDENTFRYLIEQKNKHTMKTVKTTFILLLCCIACGEVDFATLRVLGKNMLVDKNAIYYCENVIPFNKLDGFKFIFKEV